MQVDLSVGPSTSLVYIVGAGVLSTLRGGPSATACVGPRLTVSFSKTTSVQPREMVSLPTTLREGGPDPDFTLPIDKSDM